MRDHRCVAPPPPDAGPVRRSRLGVPSNLPAEVSSFVGRDDDLARGAELLERSRLVTLTGAGGCGKTRVALRLAAVTAAQFPDGVWWVELAPVDDGAALGVVLARVLGLTVAESVAAAAVLDHLGAARTLVVLDNCEHLVDAVAEFVDRLLRATAAVQVVCTSRQPLRVEGECSWRLPSMAVPPLDVAPDELRRFDAARLFLDRAAQVRPGGAAPPVPAVAQICGRLDGIPLALELAAARTASMPVDRMVTQLDNRFRLLNRGPRPAVARQRTLLASVEWSHDLLEPDEQVLLRRLGVFAGGFTVDAAEAVTGFPPLDPAGVLDVLAALTDKSLVQLEGSGRYRLLETIREFAVACLADAGETRAAADRHLGWCVELATALEPGADRADHTALDRLDLELPNLWAALDHASGAPPDQMGLRLVALLGQFWLNRGHVARGVESADRVLAADPDAPKERVAAARCVGAFARFMNVDFEGAVSEASAALAEAEAVQDVRTQGRALWVLGLAQMFSDPVAARATCTQALSPARSAGDTWCESTLIHLIAYSWFLQYRPVDGQRVHDRGAVLADVVGNRNQLAWYHINAGMAGAARGELDAAQRSYLEGAECGRRIREPVLVAYGLIGVVTVELAAGRTGELSRIFDELYGPYWGPDVPVPMFVATLPDIACLGDQPERAASGLIAGGRALIPVAPHDGIRHLLLGGSILLGLGDGPAARQAAETALAACLRITSGSAGGCRVLLARLDRQDGDGPAAERRVHEGLSEMLDAGVLIDVPGALEVLGGVAIDVGSAAEGARLLAAAAVLRADMGLYDVFAAEVDEQRDRAATALGEDFDRVWREGSALDLDAAVAYARRARGERRRPSFGWDSLTPMEREVVRLVSEGLSNPAVAAKLFVSRSTVKTHLVHVFAKLGVTNRAELAAVAIRRGQVRPGGSTT